MPQKGHVDINVCGFCHSGQKQSEENVEMLPLVAFECCYNEDTDLDKTTWAREVCRWLKNLA